MNFQYLIFDIYSFPFGTCIIAKNDPFHKFAKMNFIHVFIPINTCIKIFNLQFVKNYFTITPYSVYRNFNDLEMLDSHGEEEYDKVNGVGIKCLRNMK